MEYKTQKSVRKLNTSKIDPTGFTANVKTHKRWLLRYEERTVLICTANSNLFAVVTFGTSGHKTLHLKYAFFKPNPRICGSYEIQHPLA
jgi:hypothetical protein